MIQTDTSIIEKKARNSYIGIPYSIQSCLGSKKLLVIVYAYLLQLVTYCFFINFQKVINVRVKVFETD